MTQRARTQTSAITTDAMTDKMLKTAYREDPRIKDLDIEGLRIVLENSVLLPLRISASIVPVTFDLQLHLLVNDTETQFITSDNPVVLHNTHCQNITIRGCTGWGCAGLEVFLPLSPGACLYAYDATVYRIASQYSQVTSVSPRDVLMLNRLQWLNALENVYYAANERSVAMARESTWAKHRRPTEYIVVKKAVAEDDENNRLIHTYKPGLNIKLGLSFSSVRKSNEMFLKIAVGRFVRRPASRDHRVGRVAQAREANDRPPTEECRSGAIIRRDAGANDPPLSEPGRRSRSRD